MTGITETALRDAHQSLFATRMRIADILDRYLTGLAIGPLKLGVGPTLIRAYVFWGKIPGSAFNR